MNILDIRFRADGEKVVLQVLGQEEKRYAPSIAEWRDAKVEDLLDVANILAVQYGEKSLDKLSSMPYDHG